MAAEKISLYNLADLKNTSDDAIPNYLNSLKFRQSYFLQDVRLALGYSAFAVAALCFLWDYKLGWDSTKHFTAAAVVLYMILNAALTLWMSQKEKNVIYQGTAPGGEDITISSTTKKNVPIYNLHINVQSKKGSHKAEQKHDISAPFSEWFDEVGYFVATPFQELLASHVAVIGKQDPKRVIVKSSQEALNADADLLDAVLAASGTEVKGAGARQRKA
ncbi:hypothetical protein NQ176_g11272 [Zarea fungicola]|uniref:Uncharacterized protein n=1 Tax=Zarea fungicola TaxID=93591 RepID=A0ACC1MCI1_9HYPO|nr:hypothetical protein NQ176_g11272 [Lecanicillium fungicola]